MSPLLPGLPRTIAGSGRMNRPPPTRRDPQRVVGFIAGPSVAVTIWLSLWSQESGLSHDDLMMLDWLLLPAAITALAARWTKIEVQ